MGKGRNRRKAKKPRQKNLFAGVSKEEKLKLLHWNINGILRDSKLEQLVEILNKESIGICFLNETLLVHGTNDDLSSLDSFIVYSKERSFGSKMGGGLMTIINPRINHSWWKPRLVMHQMLNGLGYWCMKVDEMWLYALYTVQLKCMGARMIRGILTYMQWYQLKWALLEMRGMSA